MSSAVKPQAHDQRLAEALRTLGDQDEQYWSFRRQSRRDGLHGLFQYPAMMVPKMQGDVLDAVISVVPNISGVWDPFVGAGTTMLEAMARGLKFTGHDINPLAVLVCKAKSGLIDSARLQEKATTLFERDRRDRRATVDVNFPGLEKWFSAERAKDLSRIRRSILQEQDEWARTIMWVCFAETIRQVSNSRTSTYKLHIRPEPQITNLPKPRDVFKKELIEAVSRFKFHEDLLLQKSLLKRGRYSNNIKVHCSDIRNISSARGSTFDLMMTSPPYGDNRTTISYGQFSYLALNWIPEDQLTGPKDQYINAYATDTRSLGGRAINAEMKASAMCSLSGNFNAYYQQLLKVDRPGLTSKVASFIYDYFDALEVIVKKMNAGGLFLWTIGDRTVGGVPVPFVDISKELQESLGIKHVATVHRPIPTKRTPKKNSVSKTMTTECILVMRKP